jgi:hypothetical protein
VSGVELLVQGYPMNLTVDDELSVHCTLSSLIFCPLASMRKRATSFVGSLSTKMSIARASHAASASSTAMGAFRSLHIVAKEARGVTFSVSVYGLLHFFLLICVVEVIE